MKKIIIGVVVVLILVGAGWYGYGKWQDAMILEKFQTGGEKALTGEEFLRLGDILLKKYASDTYGSTTPEGTLELFVTALKAGDADLASKYFIPEKQKQAVLDIEEINKNNRMDAVILDISGYDRKACDDKNIECTFSRYYKDRDVYSLIDFILNQETKVWKITNW